MESLYLGQIMSAGQKRLIIAITGASGAIYGVRLLRLLKHIDEIETHLVISASGELTLGHELGMAASELALLASYRYDVNDVSAAIASGSFKNAGMIVAPCSMKTLSAIAHGYCDNLITRAADVVLKERRRLVLMARETPLNLAHIRNMEAVAEMGGIIYPPLPAFYCQPVSIDEMVDQTIRRVLELFDISDDQMIRWSGMV